MTNLKAKSKVRSVIAKDLHNFNSEPKAKRKYVKKDKTILAGGELPERAKRTYRKRSDEVNTGRHVIVHLAKDGQNVKNIFIDEEHASKVLNLVSEEIKRSLDSDKATNDFLVTIPLMGAFNQRKIERLARKKVKDTIMKKNVTKNLSNIDFNSIDTHVLKKINSLINQNVK